MIPQPLRLFHPQFADHIDASPQVDRMPGVDAPCMCGATRGDHLGRGRIVCIWPFCPSGRAPAVSSHESEETP